jgi:GNAT superfamily N-acetyltransferase
MRADFEIRRASSEHAVAIAAVLYQSFVEFKHLYTDGGFAATVLTAGQVVERMQQGPVWIALRQGTVQGTVAAVVKGTSVYIRGMAVVPSARGTLVATALLRQVEQWATSEGFCHLVLSTTPFLTSAIRLYEKSDFRRRDESLHDLFGTPLFTMEKTLLE